MLVTDSVTSEAVIETSSLSAQGVWLTGGLVRSETVALDVTVAGTLTVETGALLEVAGLDDDVGDTATHTGSKITTGLTQNNNLSTGHIFAGMIAGSFDHREGA